MPATPTDGAAGHGAPDRDAPEVRVSDLRASYDRRVFIDVTFTVRPGTTTVVWGPSGVGKTTLVRLLLGWLEPDRGDVTVGGRSVAGVGRAEGADVHHRTGVLLTGRGAGDVGRRGWTPRDDRDKGDDGVVTGMTVGDNVRGALAGRDDDPGALEERAQGHMVEFDLVDHEHQQVDRLPADVRRRLGLARVFAGDPTLVVLDDPVAGLEPAERDAVVASLRAVRASHSPTMIVTCHDLATTRAIGDDLVTLRAGRVGERGPAAELLAGITTDAEANDRFALVAGIADESQEALGHYKAHRVDRRETHRFRIGCLTAICLILLVAVVAVFIFTV